MKSSRRLTREKAAPRRPRDYIAGPERSGDSKRWSRLPAIGRKAYTCESKKQHGPGRGLGNCGDHGTGSNSARAAVLTNDIRREIRRRGWVGSDEKAEAVSRLHLAQQELLIHLDERRARAFWRMEIVERIDALRQCRAHLATSSPAEIKSLLRWSRSALVIVGSSSRRWPAYVFRTLSGILMSRRKNARLVETSTSRSNGGPMLPSEPASQLASLTLKR